MNKERKPNIIEIEQDDKQYEEMLNESYGTVVICGMTFDQGTALKELDPIAFRCGMADEPIRYRCLDCNDEFDEEIDASDHWNNEHKEEN